MRSKMNRRQWIKATATAGAWLVVNSSLLTCRRETIPPKAAQKDKAIQQDDFIRLDNNENPYGVSPKAQQAIIEAINGSHRYPHRRYGELIKLIAEREGLSPENIILGAGSTEIMNMAILAYGRKGEILTSDPTYFDFLFYADQAGCSIRRVPVNDSFKIDLKAMASQINSATSLIYICNPNNPTGAIIEGRSLRAFCVEASKNSLVFVDEAYHEYVEDADYASMASLVREGRKILVTRTFSKIYGLAGLRLGYGLAHPEIIENLKKAQMNFASIAYPSLKAAIEAYNDHEFTRLVKEKNKQVKAYLEKELDKLGYYRIPSHTNFALFQVDRDSKKLAEDFEKHKILVRPFTFFGQNWIRVTIGTMEEIQAFLSALVKLIYL